MILLTFPAAEKKTNSARKTSRHKERQEEKPRNKGLKVQEKSKVESKGYIF